MERSPRDLEAGARAALAAALRLVEGASSDPPPALVAEAAHARARLSELVATARGDAVVVSQGRALTELLHEAELELDLARALGAADPLAKAARSRARRAVTRDGRALLRALLSVMEA